MSSGATQPSSVRRAVLLYSAGLLSTILAGVVLIGSGHAPLGWWLVASGVVGGVIVAALIARGLRLLRHTKEGWRDADGEDGRHLGLGGISAAMDASARPRRWVGSASVPSAMGYVNVGVFLAVLEITQASIILRVRPRVAQAIFGIESLTVEAGENAVIYPARKLGQQGLEIRLPGRPSYYFWTGQRNEVLSSLAAAGFTISGDEQSMGSRHGRQENDT